MELVQIVCFFELISAVKTKLFLACSSTYLFGNQDVRKSLPIYKYREDLLKAVEEHQVIRALIIIAFRLQIATFSSKKKRFTVLKSSNNRQEALFTNPYRNNIFGYNICVCASDTISTEKETLIHKSMH